MRSPLFAYFLPRTRQVRICTIGTLYRRALNKALIPNTVLHFDQTVDVFLAAVAPPPPVTLGAFTKLFPQVSMVTTTQKVLTMTFESHGTMRLKHGLTVLTGSHVGAHSDRIADGYQTVKGGTLGRSQWLRCPCAAIKVCSGSLFCSTVSFLVCQSTDNSVEVEQTSG